ncbi:MAG: indolepyruvate ferredoxin oxidoreductase subunit alpha [Clostridiales bacterium]|nr:indolepyruvate ferredoxin oxidoreductase subunit alpha [Clostridiales bacterium]MDD7034868.1 indolepyruvate ferredoxin oxidoreductase subunit alpha [Bacillota bacterium]
MSRKFLMGNEAMGMGALAAGVNCVSGYPGTPSSEVLETVAAGNPGDIHVEWSVNEKAGLEVAAGAAMSGGRALVTMKQVGLNVASDPLMSLAYVGIKGGMVVLVADDPGPISSQTEQDTRTFAMYSKLPCFDPSTVQEAYEMMIEAFSLSEKYSTPVIMRPTTRVCHGYSTVDIADREEYAVHRPDGFVRDPGWVIFPPLAYRAHDMIEPRNEKIGDEFSSGNRNCVVLPDGDRAETGIVSGGISWTYVREAVECDETIKAASPALMKISTPFPFPEKAAVDFLKRVDRVLCVEELDPFIERQLLQICGKYGLGTVIEGKLTHMVRHAGENTRDSVRNDIRRFLGAEEVSRREISLTTEGVPSRPPVLCAGCPHRAAFYSVKVAMKGQKTVFCGDIGCYTLGNAQPLDMVDTCLCMGAGVNQAQGIYHMEPDRKCFAFVGDSTFFASAVTGVMNSVYNGGNMTLVVLDNSTTAMTGHQPHPGTGRTMMGETGHRIDLVKVLEGIGLDAVETADPLNLTEAVETVRRVSDIRGTKAIIFKSPCIARSRNEDRLHVTEDRCKGCRRCVDELGCPALGFTEGKAYIDGSSCNGCGLCSQVCPFGAFASEKEGSL